jgi:hypothetical protein
MAFKKITADALLQNNELRSYLGTNWRYFSPTRKGDGTFVSKKSVAPESLKRFGIVLPKGGMIIPGSSRDEILAAIKKAAKKEEFVVLLERRRAIRALGVKVMGRKAYIAPIEGVEVSPLWLTVEPGQHTRRQIFPRNVVERAMFLEIEARRIAREARNIGIEKILIYAGEWTDYCAGAYIRLGTDMFVYSYEQFRGILSDFEKTRI